MKPTERDDLLIRLDERTSNIWRVTEEQGQHLKEINGALASQFKTVTRNSVKIGLMWKVGGGALVIIIGVLVTLLTS